MSRTSIGPVELIEAMCRWEDFQRCQTPAADHAEVKARIAAGERASTVLREEADEYGEQMVNALALVKESCGLTPGARLAFSSEIPNLLHGLEHLPFQDAVEQAAMIGLVVGLTAQQLAAEAPCLEEED